LNSRKSQLTQIAAHAGFLYSAKSALPKCCSFKITDGGLLTLSKYPIIEEHFVAYNKSAFSDSISYKGVLYTMIELPNQSYLHLFNTHLNASYITDDI
jgi:sphingomyelin phosphodiesterase